MNGHFYCDLGIIQKQVNWMLYELKPRGVVFFCEQSLQGQIQKELLVKDQKLIMIILSALFGPLFHVIEATEYLRLHVLDLNLLLSARGGVL